MFKIRNSIESSERFFKGEKLVPNQIRLKKFNYSC